MEKEKRFGFSSSTIHILAMFFMLLDHMWATVIHGELWLTCVGRIAFPMFAFLTVEGFVHTSNLKKYALRLFIFALISEVPFNLMYSGGVIYPYHQNVIWTFLIAIGFLTLIKLSEKTKIYIRIIVMAGALVAGYYIGFLTMIDYFGYGVATVILLYVFRGEKWWQRLAQAAALIVINAILMNGQNLDIHGFLFPVQAFAVLSLIPMWLYNGKKGIKSPVFKWFCYGFYPGHMLILALIALYA